MEVHLAIGETQKCKNWFRMRAIPHKWSVEGAFLSSPSLWSPKFEIRSRQSGSRRQTIYLRHLHLRWALDYIFVVDKCRGGKCRGRCQEERGSYCCEFHLDKYFLGNGTPNKEGVEGENSVVKFLPRGVSLKRKKGWKSPSSPDVQFDDRPGGNPEPQVSSTLTKRPDEKRPLHSRNMQTQVKTRIPYF